MTKQVFIKLAAEFAALKPDPRDGDLQAVQASEEMRCCLARRAASVCQEVNPLFDRARFLKACEVEE